MKDWLKNQSLNEVDFLFRDGRISREEAEEFVAWWNSSPKRGSVAKVYSRSIGNKVKED